jgi:hypothetical protein
MVNRIMARAIAFFSLLAVACASGPSVRFVVRPGPPVQAEAVAVLPLAHRFAAQPQEAFLRALPLCEDLLAHGGLWVIGPDEVAVREAGLADARVYSETGLVAAALRAGQKPERTLVLRGVAEERVVRTSKALFDRSGRPRGAAREVEVAVRLVVELLHPPEGRMLARAELVAEEDPFAENPEHDRRPVLTSLLRGLAPALLARARPRLTLSADAPPPLEIRSLPSPRVLEEFHFSGGSSLSERARRDPLLGPVLAEVFRRALGRDIQENEIRQLRMAPPGVFVRAPHRGLAAGDVILSVDGQTVLTPWALQRALLHPSSPGELRVWRAGKIFALRLSEKRARVEGGEGAPAEIAGDGRAIEIEPHEAMAMRAKARPQDLRNLLVELLPERVDLPSRGVGHRTRAAAPNLLGPGLGKDGLAEIARVDPGHGGRAQRALTPALGERLRPGRCKDLHVSGLLTSRIPLEDRGVIMRLDHPHTPVCRGNPPPGQ